MGLNPPPSVHRRTDGGSRRPGGAEKFHTRGPLPRTIFIMKGLLAAVAIAFLAVVAHPNAADRTPELPRDSHLTSVPSPAPAISSEHRLPARPGLPDVAPVAVDSGLATLADLRTPAAAGRPSVLIAARLREKYRPFQESLTSP